MYQYFDIYRIESDLSLYSQCELNLTAEIMDEKLTNINL